MATKKRTTRTKQETQDQFNEVQSRVAGKEKLSPREQELKAQQETTVRGAVQGLKVETVLGRITTVSLDAQRALSNVSEQLQQQTQLLTDIQAAVKLGQEELEELHGKDVAASALEDLVEEYKTKQEALDTQFGVAEENHDKKLEEMEASFQQRKADRTRQHEREEQEFAYNRDLQRKQDADKWAEQCRQRTVAEVVRQEQLQKDWANREELLKKREEEFAKAKAEVELFPAKLESETKKAVAIAENSIKREYEHRIQLLTKDFEAGKKESEIVIATLNKQLQAATAQVEQLQARIAQVDDKVKDIAVEAMKSASSQKALGEIALFSQGGRDGGATRKST